MPNEYEQRGLNDPNQMAGPHRDRQGVDKAPGEETPTAGVQENTVAETQKGKQQVDADVSQSEDRAAGQP